MAKHANEQTLRQWRSPDAFAPDVSRVTWLRTYPSVRSVARKVVLTLIDLWDSKMHWGCIIAMQARSTRCHRQLTFLQER